MFSFKSFDIVCEKFKPSEKSSEKSGGTVFLFLILRDTVYVVMVLCLLLLLELVVG